jgi:hypothetical protein
VLKRLFQKSALSENAGVIVVYFVLIEIEKLA